MSVSFTEAYNQDHPLIDYSASYETPTNKEPAATLENLYPARFPLVSCMFSTQCDCSCAPVDPEDPEDPESPT